MILPLAPCYSPSPCFLGAGELLDEGDAIRPLPRTDTSFESVRNYRSSQSRLLTGGYGQSRTVALVLLTFRPLL